MGYCDVRQMAVQVNFCSGYCPVGLWSGQANVYQASVNGLLSGQVTVQSVYCSVGLLSGQATVFWVSVYWATACRGCVLGEVSIGLVSDCSKLVKNWKNDSDVTIFQHDVIIDFFDLFCFSFEV